MRITNFFKLATMALMTISLFTFGTCADDEDEPNDKPNSQQLKVEPRTLSFPAEGGTATIDMTITGYKYYGVYIENGDKVDWLTMTNRSQRQCSFLAKANNTGASRSCNVVIYATNEDGELESLDQTNYVKVGVTQPSGAVSNITLELEKETVEYDSNKHNYWDVAVKFTTNTELAAGEFTNVSDVKWIEMYTDGWRHNEIRFDIQENTSSEPRTGHITATIEKNGVKVEKTLTIIQQGYVEPPVIDVENFGGIGISFDGCVNVTRTYLNSGEVEHLVDCVTNFNPFIRSYYWTTEEGKAAEWKHSVSSNDDGGLHLESRWDSPSGAVHLEATADIDVNNIHGTIKNLTANRQIDHDDYSVHTMITAHNIPLNGGGKASNGSDITIVETTHNDYGMIYITAGGRIPVDHVVNGVAYDDWYLKVSFYKNSSN